jgi:hypothetical protein
MDAVHERSEGSVEEGEGVRERGSEGKKEGGKLYPFPFLFIYLFYSFRFFYYSLT